MSTVQVNRFEDVNGVGFGMVLQSLSSVTGAVATGTTVVPFDDTIPQITEGDQYMSLAVTPRSSTNILKISITVMISSSVINNLAVALFQDSTADALAVVAHHQDIAGGVTCITLTHLMTAGTTSATTFKVRCGGNAAGTTTFNGTGAARRYGGVACSSITIEEIQV